MRVKKYLDFAKDKLSKLFTNKCEYCNEEMVDYGGSVGGLNPEPLYVCDNKECVKNKKHTI